MKLVGLFLTLISGLFFLVGYFLVSKVKDKAKLTNFSIALALVIMLTLIFEHLVPEIYELITNINNQNKYLIIIGFILIGFLLLKLLDIFIPHHYHHHKEYHDNQKEHNAHVSHIGLITLISLILHNILEGFAIFSMSDIDLKVGILTTLSIALHNIPLGIQIFSMINLAKSKLATLSLIFSSFIGGLIFLAIGQVSAMLIAIITSITLGMLLYITFLELLLEVIKNIKHKPTIAGLFSGCILAIITIFI